MADKKQFDDGAPPVGSSDPSDLDPFAELSRIIGYNPRPELEAASEADDQADEPLDSEVTFEEELLATSVEPGEDAYFADADPLDDFGIDLERELLGDLAAEMPVAAASEIPSVEPAPHQGDATTDTDFGAVEDDLELAAEEFDAVIVDEPQPVAVVAVEAPFVTAKSESGREGLGTPVEAKVDGDDIFGDIDQLNAAFASDLHDEVAAEVATVESVAVEAASDEGGEFESEAEAADLDEFDFDDVDFGDIEDAIGREMDQAIAASSAAADPDADFKAVLDNAFDHDMTAGVEEAVSDASEIDPEMDWAELDATVAATAEGAAAASEDTVSLDKAVDRAEEAVAATITTTTTTTTTTPGAAVNSLPASLEDPFEALAKMAERYQIPQYSNEPVRPAAVSPHYRDAAPEVETTEIYDRAYSVADDLDLPEVSYDEPQAAASDLDLEFDNLLNEMSRGEPLPKPATASAFEAPRYETREPLAPRQASASDDFGFESVFAQGGFEPEQQDDLGSFEFDDEADDNDPPPPPYRGGARGNGGRNMMIAAIVGGIAVLGGLGAIAMSWTGGSDGAPVLVAADGKPVKIRPENPGGIAVPNKDSTVYDVVSRSGAEAPSQERLVSNTEDPIALPQMDDQEGDDIAAMTKGEDRVEPGLAEEVDQETVAVAPRKVRTVIVRPDGTLAPAEEPAVEATNSTAAPEPAAPVDEIAAASIEEPEQITTGATTPTQPAKVAAVAGGWSVQIASQPSEAGATKSLQDISRRYSGVIGDRGSNIVKAEVPGKGTFWRVRLAAASRDDAVSLCSSLKSAGGSCFVTR